MDIIFALTAEGHIPTVWGKIGRGRERSKRFQLRVGLYILVVNTWLLTLLMTTDRVILEKFFTFKYDLQDTTHTYVKYSGTVCLWSGWHSMVLFVC